jgi:sulfur relay (sulfurtransferase) DsrF/TusC family protein
MLTKRQRFLKILTKQMKELKTVAMLKNNLNKYCLKKSLKSTNLENYDRCKIGVDKFHIERLSTEYQTTE